MECKERTDDGGTVNTLSKERTEVNVGQRQIKVRTFNKSNKEVNRVVIKGMK